MPVSIEEQPLLGSDEPLMALTASMLHSGVVLSRYRILHKLGAGGMGEVYKAVDLELEGPVALKILLGTEADRASEHEALLREARLARSIHHPNIVTIYTIDHSEGLEFIVMEFVEGKTLRDLLRDGPLDATTLLEVGIQVADALAAAHEVGLLHRDVKPGNVMLTPQGQAKVLDFGIAKRAPSDLTASAQTETLTSTAHEVIQGTLPYMSPEQARGEPLDARSDLFSLGSVLYECATGQRAFSGSSPTSVLHQILAVEPPPPSQLQTGLAPSFDAVLARAMAKDPSRRFGSGRELAAALKAVREGAAPAPAIFATPAAASETPNNLPIQLTRFIGRAREVAEIKSLLASSRLVSLTGAGGCGKTRLAIRVGEELLRERSEGIWFVNLAPVSDPDVVVQAVADVLSVREQPGKALQETLTDHLVGTTALLILDNCEHVVRACAALASGLLYACPGLRVLATSREALHLPGEAVWRTPSLSVPPDRGEHRAPRDWTEEFESVQLFRDRAEAVHSPFMNGKQSLEVVGQICRRLDGIPLAIELAAARTRALSPQDILDRIEDRFRLLTGGGEALVGRQQTLRATVDWSYELLSREEQLLFQRLGAFAGGFTLDAAEAIGAGESVESAEVLSLLVHLVEKSLLIAEENPGGSGRYRLLESLRAYAREKLRASGGEPAVRERHRAWFLDEVERSETKLHGPDQAQWFQRLGADLDDIRVAIRLAIEAPDGHAAARFCGAFWRFWWVRGLWSEGRARLRETLALCEEGTNGECRIKLLHGSAVLARGQGAYDEAESLLTQGLALARERSDPRGIGTILHELANIANEHGDLAAARSLYEESLGFWRALRDQRGISSVLHNLGVVAQSQRDFGAAEKLYRESLDIQRELGNRAWEAAGLNGLGSVALARDDFEAARSCHEQALVIQKELGDRWGAAFSMRELGIVATRTGDLAAASDLLARSLSVLHELGDREGIAESLEALVGLAMAQADPDRALQLAGAAFELRERIGSPLMPVDRKRLDAVVRQARQALGKGASTKSYAEGRRLSIDQAVRYALQEVHFTSRSVSR